MAQSEEPKKLESETPSDPPPAPATPATSSEEKPAVEEAPKEECKEKSQEKAPEPADESKAVAIVEKPCEPAEEKKSKEVSDRDAVLARVETEKKISLINAWEESEKSKVENKAHKKLSVVGSWENTKKASVEAELKIIEEKLEKKKAEAVEQMKNKIALIHKAAEEKRALIEAKRAEDLLKAEENAAKYRATGKAPKKLLSFF
ncbi:PREDICTED: remorin-like isoform X1 [Fragaria vesca subsp. vesca]|uniref:remorin-like isoform X1 n=1 Tax=Fragaria vesca subsp. vesca TaxID=101020 RepID=UPI0002C31589|nr:PREDICTED: remorin-like isoform X1 [Fragaria vesca subsp. vesca]